MKKCPLYINIIFFMVDIIIVICGCLYIYSDTSFVFYGFGFDSYGKLYVGWGSKIDVYKDNKKIHMIETGTNEGGYNFTIQGDDTILLTHDSDVVIMDLMGNKIFEKRIELDKKTSKALKKGKYEFRTVDGVLYTASYFPGIARIYKDGKLVFQTPVIDCVVFYVFIIAFTGKVIAWFILRRKYENICC